MKILGIETSCDETSAAVVEDGTKIISNAVASSSKMHEKYGGIVPEVAARAQLEYIIPVISEALKPLCNYKKYSNEAIRQCICKHADSIAVTVGPGLIGSLLVGVEAARTIAYVCNKPIIPVNHVMGHIYANLLNPQTSTRSSQPIDFPAVALVASGGHTELYLMKSVKNLVWLGGAIDDAAGEAFDKAGRLIGLGAGGGQAIERLAKKAKCNKKKANLFPRPMIKDKSLNFSFSGLKTAVLREITKSKKMKQWDNEIMSVFAFEIQEAICDVLVEKTVRAARAHQAKSILISGGVAANKRLRKKFNLQPTAYNPSATLNVNLQLVAPPAKLCTDNAAFIASCAHFIGKSTNWKNIHALPDLQVSCNYPSEM